MTRVYWSTVDARRRTVYTCRILAAQDSTASRSNGQIQRGRKCPEETTDELQECTYRASTVSDTVTGPTSVNAASDFIGPFADGKTCHFNSNKSEDKVACDSSVMQHWSNGDELTTTCQPGEQSTTGNDAAESCSAASTQAMLSLDTSPRCRQLSSSQSTQLHKHSSDNLTADTTRTAGSSSVPLIQDHLPTYDSIQHRSFADSSTFAVSDKGDVADVAESNVCVGGLRSDFDRRNCAPLKLISQLDGPVPESESEASDDEANVPDSCVVLLSRSLAPHFCRPFTTAGRVSSPFKCVKCRRVYRTEESCALHSAVCMFEVSSSSDSEEPDCDGGETVEPSDAETDSCCSDEGDDGVISHYLTSSRISGRAVNCSSLGCQTEDDLVSSEECDVNANCKMLCDSNTETEQCGHETADESDSATNRTENQVGCQTSQTVMTHSTANVAGTDKMSSSSASRTAVNVSIQIDKTVGSDLRSDMVASVGQLTASDCLWRENLACTSKDKACGSAESLTTSVSSVKSVACCVQADYDAAYSWKGVRYTSTQAFLQPSHVQVASNHSESKATERNVVINQQMTGVSVAVCNAVSNITLAGQQKSSLAVSSKTSDVAVVSAQCNTVEDCSRTAFKSCSSQCLSGVQNAASASLSASANGSFPRKVGDITSSLSVCVLSHQYAVKPQDVLTTSASMVWPHATVTPSIVNNSLSVASSNGICTQLLAAPWVPLGVLTTASVVIPAAVPNAAWIRPLNVAQPLYALRPSQSRSFGQPVQLIQQFVHPAALIAPVTWLDPEFAVMNAVRPLTLCPAATSSFSSHFVSSQRSLSSTFTVNVPSANQQSVLSLNQVTTAEHNSQLQQKAVNSAAVYTASLDIRPTPTCPQVSRLSLSAASLQSVSRAALDNEHSVPQLVFATGLSQYISVPSPTACIQSYLSSSSTDAVAIKQLQVNSSLTQHISSAAEVAPSTLSKYDVSCGSTSCTWSTGTTPMTVSSLSSNACERNENIMASLSIPGRCNIPVTPCRIDTGMNANVSIVTENQSFSTPRFGGSLPVHTDISAANLITCQSTNVAHLSLSSAADVQKSLPICFPVSSTSFIPSSASVSSVHSSSGITEAVVNCSPLAGSSTRSPRLIIQPSSLAVNTESVYKTPPCGVAHLPPVGTSPPSLPVRKSPTCDTEYVASSTSPACSQLATNIVTSLSDGCDVQVTRSLPWIATTVGTSSYSVHHQQICSPVNHTATQSSDGKYNSVLMLIYNSSIH